MNHSVSSDLRLSTYFSFNESNFVLETLTETRAGHVNERLCWRLCRLSRSTTTAGSDYHTGAGVFLLCCGIYLSGGPL